MSTFGTIATIGAAALVLGAGVGIYIMSKNRNPEENLNFDGFRDKCISQAAQFSKENVATSIIVIDKINDNVIPSLYRKYEDGRVTKIRLNVKPFQYIMLPESVRDKFNNVQADLSKL